MLHVFTWTDFSYFFSFLELYEFCLKEGYADKNLIAKWKKQGYENLCCLRCIQCRDTNFGTNCICRVPKAKLEEVSSWFSRQSETLARSNWIKTLRARRKLTSKLTHIWHRPESNPVHIGGRHVFSPLHYSCSPDLESSMQIIRTMCLLCTQTS